jgi:hypothetical protein
MQLFCFPAGLVEFELPHPVASLPLLTPSLSLLPRPQAFTHLEQPAALALLHINASRAAPRLSAPALRAHLAAAQGSASLAQDRLREMYRMPQMHAGSNDTQLQLLGEWQEASVC